MASEGNSLLELDTDAKNAIANVTELGSSFKDLKKAAGELGTAASKAFAPMTEQLKNIWSGVKDATAACVEFTASLDGADIISNLSKGVSDAFSGIAEGYKGITQFFDKTDKAEKYSVKIQGLFEELVTAPNMGNFMKSMFPKSAELFSTVGQWTDENVISAITGKLSASGGVVGVGLSNMINSISGAFKGIGSALSGMSLGWGAAIAGIVTLIVLLVTNWDTVKAAVLTAWEAIKGAPGTAAEWLNTNLLQPVSGFFTTAMDWITEKVQAGFAFVQSIFAKVGEFLQGAFAKDWTEQFGAFGNVLNAFFANIQNVWNAVKNIFTGIVSFVKNVFAGDWGAAWDSIVQVFKGIWEYLVAVVKAPINGIIGMINALVGGVVSGINIVINALNKLKIDIPDWVPGLGGKSFGFDITPLTAPKIPLLAQGAVLPANKPFMAVVGDQKSGVNVEAPLDTIKQAVAEVLAGQGGGDVVIKFTGDLAQLARVLKPAIDRENRRVGGSLAKGVV